MSMIDKAWNKIFQDYGINKHDFEKSPFKISAREIKTGLRLIRIFIQVIDLQRLGE